MKPLDNPPATSTSPRESSSPSKELSLSRSEPSPTKESEAVVAQHTSMAVEETPCIAREETPRKSDSPDARADVRQRAREAAAARIASAAKKKMVLNEPDESALVFKWQLARERPRPSSPLLSWLSSGSPH